MTNEKKQNLKPRASEDQEKTGRPTDGIDKQKSLGKSRKRKRLKTQWEAALANCV